MEGRDLDKKLSQEAAAPTPALPSHGPSHSSVSNFVAIAVDH